MVGVASKNIPNEKFGVAQDLRIDQFSRDLYVSIKLSKPLCLQIRGSKRPYLLGVECCIPDLGNYMATSINSVYTKISEVFEPDRKLHTGNVFKKCFNKGKDDNWCSLDSLRKNIEGGFEEELFWDYKTYILNTNKFNMQDVDKNEMLMLGYLHQYGEITGA